MHLAGLVHKGKTPLDAAEMEIEIDLPEIKVAKKETATLLRKHGGNTKLELEGAEPVAEASQPENRRQTKHQTSQFTKLLKLEILKRSCKALAAGVDVNAKDKDGYTPLDWATQRNHPETADLLRKHGGKTKEELKTEGK